ncbi:MAG: hypothetical protein Q4C49_08785 [Bacillota bacterium]|nr:hypothetical protein [Bacillota bacterium]
MNIFDLIDSKSSSFSKNDNKIYESLKKQPDFFVKSTITEITEHTGISKAALTRFAQKLNFSGFIEFQYELCKEYLKPETEERSNARYLGDILIETEKILKQYPLDKLARKIKDCNCLSVSGTNLLECISDQLKLSMNIESTQFIDSTNADNIRINLNKNDVLMIYSSIKGTSYQKIVRYYAEKNNRPYMVLVTPNSKHPLRHNFDEVIRLPSAKISKKTTANADIHEYVLFNEMLMDEYLKLD